MPSAHRRTMSSGSAGSRGGAVSAAASGKPYLTVVTKICQLEVDPEAVSMFFRGNAAITVRAEVLCGENEVLAAARSRTLMNFEDDIDVTMRVPLTEAQYERLVLENVDSPDGSALGNCLRFSVLSVTQDGSGGNGDGDGGANDGGGVGSSDGAQHAGESKPLPLLDVLDGLLLPTVEPNHPREFEFKLRNKPQAVLMLKLWVEPSARFDGADAAFAAFDDDAAAAAPDADVAAGPSGGGGTANRASSSSSSSRRAQNDEAALERAARALGIDPVAEAQLLWIAREALETPPPPFWVELPVDNDDERANNGNDGEDGGRSEYRNVRTGAVADTNPAFAYFEQLTAKERQRLGNAVAPEEEEEEEEEEDEEGGTDRAEGAAMDAGTCGDAPPADDGGDGGGGGGGGTWIRVGGRGGRYYYNFEEKERVDDKEELPPRARVVEALPSLVEPYQANGSGDLGDGTSVRTLTFYTWWKEGTVDGLKRFTAKVVYDLATQNFIVSFQDSHDSVTLSEVPGRYGPLTQWDLRVTGVIDLLGRKTTLMQCDESTLKWLDYRARRLVKLRAAFKAEIVKYDPLLKGRDYIHPAFRKDGKTDLASIIRQVEELYLRLAKFRKGLAKKMLAGFEEVLSLALLKTGKS